MALAKVIQFGEQLLLWGDGADPEEFTPLCGFTNLELTVNIETNSTNVPDCDDPSLPAWLVSSEVSKQMQLGGNGVIDSDALAEFNEWLLTGGEKNFRWLTNSVANPEANGYWAAPGIMSAYGQTGERGQLWNQSTTILLNGRPNRVDLNAAPSPTAAPVLSGTAEVGELLTVTNGTWANTPTSFAHRWTRNGTAIPAATAATYTLVPADEGALIRARVTAFNASGSFTSSSNTLGPVAP